MEINPNLSENAKRDAELIIAACAGVEKAFAQLMSRYKDAIYFMLLRMVKNKQDAEELTMEAFGKAFSNIHQYEPHFAFSTWLFCIASNSAIDHLRKKRIVTVQIESSVIHDKNIGINYNYCTMAYSENPEESYIKVQNAKLLRVSFIS